jgi:hypothetical protein
MKLYRVTDIISPWANYQYAEEKHLIRGSIVHRACLNYAQGLWSQPLPVEYEGYLQSFKDWLRVVKEVHAAEKELIDKELGIIGHIDLLVTMVGDNCLTIPDLKTSQSHNQIWRLQLALYKHLAEKNRIKVKRVISVRPDRDGGPAKVKEYLYHTQDLAVALSALNVTRFINQ